MSHALHVVKDPRHAALLAAPIRQRILEALEEPGSASTIAAGLRMPRQKVAYHVRQLEEHGFVKLVREEQRRGCTERFVQRTARYLVASSEVFGRAGLDAKRLQDKFSGSYLVALASRMAREVADAQTAAERAGQRLATLSTEVEVRLRSPADRAAFAEELVDAIARIAAKYHDENHPDGRSYRVIAGAYPVKGKRP
jgi:DNA-binding transcriptional ArsR family regulator